MSDWIQKIFGGGHEETGSHSESHTIDILPEIFKQLRGPFAEALLGMLKTGGPEYKGPLVADLGKNEKTVLDQLMSMTGPGTSRNQYLESVMKGDFLPGGEKANPFLDAAIQAAQRTTQQGLEETLSRALPGRFTQAGQYTQPESSSAFDRAAAIAYRGAAQTMGDIATNISYNTYNEERNRQNQAAGLSQAEVDLSMKNLQAQALPRMIQDMGIQRGMELFQQRTQQFFQILALLAGVTRPVPGQESTSDSYGFGDKYNGIFNSIFPKGLF